jgi:protoporphyrinogen IX oxidase
MYSAPWFYAKFALVLALSVLKGFFSGWVCDFDLDRNRRSQRFYRIINEVPAMIGIVIMVVSVRQIPLVSVSSRNWEEVT